MAVDRVALLERIGLALARLGLAPPPLPVPFYDGYLGLLGARAVMAATRLGVIRALAERADDARGLARRLELDPDRLEVLLAALASLGYVRRRRDGRWAPTRMARRWLAPDGIDAMVGELAYEVWTRAGRMEEVLAGGDPSGWHGLDADDPMWPGYQRGMAQLARLTASDLAAAIPVESPRTLLDLGGGPGPAVTPAPSIEVTSMSLDFRDIGVCECTYESDYRGQARAAPRPHERARAERERHRQMPTSSYTPPTQAIPATSRRAS